MSVWLILSNVVQLDFNDFIDALAGLFYFVFVQYSLLILSLASIIIGRVFAGEWCKLNFSTVLIANNLSCFLY